MIASYQWSEVIDRDKPMAAARVVRRDKYAWPGGYPLALLTTDGGTLCPACVAAEFPAVSWSHRHAVDDGWRPAAVMVLEGSAVDYGGAVYCDHCSAELVAPDESGEGSDNGEA
jgi:hypothetical protein